MPNDFMQQMLAQMAIYGVLGLIYYVYLSSCLMITAGKLGVPGGWMAWIPIANMVLVCRMAKRPGAWVVLLLIPFVNLIVLFILMMDVARARGKNPLVVFTVLIPPVGMLLVPAVLAMGPATVGGAAPQPAGPVPPPIKPVNYAPAGPPVCPACGRTECVGEEFCGYTGKRIAGMPAAPAPGPVAPPIAQPAAASSSSGPMVKVLAALVLIAGLATTGYGIFSRIFGRSNPANLPATASNSGDPARRASGTLSLFPVDNAPTPAKPVSVVSQNLSKGDGALKVPAKWLPPGVNGSRLKTKSASTITSAEYKTAPQDSPVDVHVVEMPPAPPVECFQAPCPTTSGNASTVASWVTEATGTQPVGVTVKAPDGQIYGGQAIKTSQITVYVLNNPTGNAVVIIYAGDPAARATADRLAGNVGNGQGLSDYPQTSTALTLTPDTLNGGLQLESSNTMDTASIVSPSELQSVVGDSPQAQQWIDQAKSYMPATVTSAIYRDPSRRPWDVYIGDFGGIGKSWYTWMALKFLIGLSGMQSTDGGYTADQGDGRMLLQRSGRYIYLMRAPTGTGVDAVSQAARSFTF